MNRKILILIPRRIGGIAFLRKILSENTGVLDTKYRGKFFILKIKITKNISYYGIPFGILKNSFKNLENLQNIPYQFIVADFLKIDNRDVKKLKVEIKDEETPNGVIRTVYVDDKRILPLGIKKKWYEIPIEEA